MTRKRPIVDLAPTSDRGDDLTDARTTESVIAVTPISNLRDRPTFTLISGVDAGQLFSLGPDETIIGRTKDSRVRIDDVGISRRHARVVRGAEGASFIEDLGSTNGIYVNGERMQRAKLAPGDQVQVGPNVTLRFSLIDAGEEALARQLFDSSTRDALTRAYNRKYLTGRLVAEIAFAERHRTRLGLILFDLDHFKRTNDTYGHIAGDTVLQNVAALVARLIRTEDVFARYGGEEFVVLVRGIPHENVARFAERLRKGVEALEIPWEKTGIKATVSIGVASFREEGEVVTEAATAGGEALLERADGRLYRAKAAGRNRVVS